MIKYNFLQTTVVAMTLELKSRKWCVELLKKLVRRTKKQTFKTNDKRKEKQFNSVLTPQVVTHGKRFASF